MAFVEKGKPNYSLSRDLSFFSSPPAFRCPIPGLTYLHAIGILLHHSAPGAVLSSPPGRGSACARGAAARRLRRRCPKLGDNGKPQLGAALALALSLSPSTATQGAPPRQFTTSRSSPGARKWLDRF